MNEDAVERITDDPDVLQAVPVKFDAVQVGSPEFGVLARWIGVGPTQAIQILPQAPKRKTATIRCTTVSGGGARAVVGSLGQIGNGSSGAALTGFDLGAGESLTYTAQQPLWVICDTTAQTVNIAVCDERYR